MIDDKPRLPGGNATVSDRPRILIPLVAIAIAAALVTGCGSAGGSDEETPDAPRAVIVDGKYTDLRFIDMMVPHHEMAIEMAKNALEKSKNKDILTLADRILRGQTNEIEELKRVRAQVDGSRTTPDAMHPDVMANMGMGDHGTPSAQSSEDHGHSSTPGPSDEFDRAFLDDMIAHHAAAIRDANLALIHSDNLRLKVIAREIVDEQAREIGMMAKWRLDRWEHVL